MTARPRVRVIVQARMGSTRFPGKIAADLLGEPMLARVTRRLRLAKYDGVANAEVVVATSVDPLDDRTVRLCESIGVRSVRGSHEDVLDRYLAASADLDDADIVIRATADNCLYCPVRTAAIVEHHRVRRADYTSIDNLSYVVPEVMLAGALRTMAARALSPYCREHVTPYFREHPDEFAVEKLPATWMGLRPDLRLTVDTPDELAQVGWILEQLGTKDDELTLERIYDLCDQRHPTAAI